MKPISKFTCPCCGSPLRFEEWAAMRQEYKTWMRQLVEGKGGKVKYAQIFRTWH